MTLPVSPTPSKATPVLTPDASDSTDPSANERLMAAVSASRIEDVRSALLHGADPNARDQHKTALHWAAYNGHEEIVRLLLTAGAQAQTLNRHGETPLHEVAASSAYGNDDSSRAGARRIVVLLLDAGADPKHVSKENLVSRRGRATAAHTLAATIGGDLALREILRVAPNLVHAVDQRGDTPLTVAVLERRPDAVEALLEAGADPLTTNPSGESPMNLAQRIQPALAERFNVELVQRERAALVPLLNPEVASMTPSRLKARL